MSYKSTAVEQIIGRMRDRKIRITSARLSIVTTLIQSGRPLSADEIHHKLAGKIDRVTVYRTILLLENADCLSRFTFHNKHVYELASEHSHYLICRNCEIVERIPSCTLNNLEKLSLRSSKKFFSVDRHALQLTGVCKRCVSE